MDRLTTIVYYAICTACGRRPWCADARALDARCDACARVVDHWQPTIERRPPARVA